MYVFETGIKIRLLAIGLWVAVGAVGCSQSNIDSTAASSSSNVEEKTNAPEGLSYFFNPATYTISTAITANFPSLTAGEASSFTISPSLPDGLSLDGTTGEITGTPTALSAAATYTVTAQNASGSTSIQLNLAVVDVAPTNLSYSAPTPTYIRRTAITDNTPTVSGGAVTSYSVSPALPQGLTLDSATGVISGTPDAYLPSATQFLITASNSGGSTTATIDLIIDVPAGTWLGGTGTNWTTAANWKGGAMPLSSGAAYFDDSCSPNCSVTIDSNLTVKELYMYSSFSGTITQAAGRTITVGTGDYDDVGGWYQYGGSFVGGDSNIRLDRIDLTGGSFTSTSAELRLGIDTHWHSVDYGFTFGAAATFNHNNGKLYLDGQGSTTGDDRNFVFSLDKALTLYDFEADLMSEQPESNGLYNNKYADINGTTPTIQVLNNFVLHDGEIRLGNIEFLGANAHFGCAIIPNQCSNMFNGLRHTYATDGPSTLTRFKFMGGGAQTYSFDSGASSPFVFYIDNANGVSTSSPSDFNIAGLEIENGAFTAPSATLYFGKDGYLHHFALPDFYVGSSGSFVANGGTVIVKPNTTYTNSRQFFEFVSPNSPLSFYNLTLDIDSGTTASIDDNFAKIPDGTNLIIENDLRIKQGRFLKDFGDTALITVRGDYYQDCDDKANGQCAGSNERTPLLFDTDGSTINIAAGIPESFYFSNIEINVPGGTVTINSGFTSGGTGGDFTLTAGSLHIANASTVVWSDDLVNNGAITCDASSYFQVLDLVSGTPQAGNDPSCYGP